MKKLLSIIIFLILFLVSCTAKETKIKEAAVNAFKSVSMEEGLKLMARDTDFVLLDVRTPEEYAAGHIPGSVQLTNETFTEQDAGRLIKNKSQTIYVYCRSGRRSKQSAQKLIDFGYAKVIEIGGIIAYDGPIEK
ncbi:rhodanese-like domain-containing protein [Treponema sp.]|uniref:rhodanese-like domain-containing protein n=1 Tax=Treponema sp. TaxID=166 RepID=UPI00298E625A|nr:rhodanese-like domain-containing protein [Treponema sp.]MCQ2240003.1 rhodanese-like domain-containing protein [Treponema sp.]